MARIPTLLSNDSLQAPSFTARPDDSSFNSTLGLGQVAGGLERLSDGVTDLANTAALIKRQRANEVDQRWIGDSIYSERNHLNAWQADPKNNGSEDFATEFKKYAESRFKEYEGAAPSKQAAAQYKEHIQSFVEQRYASALLTSERTRVENTKDSIINQTSLTLSTFRGAGGTPNVDSRVELQESHQDIHARIEQIYGETDPALRRKLGAYVDAEIALGLGSVDPDSAKQMIKNSGDLEESAKVTLINKIESMESDLMSAGRDDFNKFRGDYQILVREGKRKDSIPLSEYQQYYDKNTAAKLKAADDERIQVYTEVNEEFGKLSGTSVDHQNTELAKKKSGLTTTKDDAVLQLLAHKLSETQELQKKDPVSWLAKYNQEVTGKIKEVVAATTTATLQAKNAAILKYQGAPPDGAKDPERYLNLPILDRKVMSLDEVTKSQAFINQGTPPEVIKRIEQVLASYVGFEDVAFDNMVDGPDGIKQEYRLVWQNKDQWWVQSFIGALGESKGLSVLTDERKGELSTEVDQNTSWKIFEQAMIGPDPGKAGEIAGFKRAIMTYANYFAASQGLKINEAVKHSVDHLINSTTGSTKVNGRPIIVMKDNPGRPPRTDEEIIDIGRRLTVSLKDLDPREINQEKFGLHEFGTDEKNIDRLQALRNFVTRNGHFVPSQDGQSMLLYVAGDAGIQFPVTDKNNRQFAIQLNDLPMFEAFRTGSFVPGASSVAYDLDISKDPSLRYRSLGLEAPKDTYQLQDFPPTAGFLDKTLWHWGGNYSKSTYWPTNSGYWKRKGDPFTPKKEFKGLETLPYTPPSEIKKPDMKETSVKDPGFKKIEIEEVPAPYPPIKTIPARRQ